MAKVRGMLDEQLRGSGNPQWSHDATIGLDDMGINKTQSSRWQQIFRIGTERRHGGGILYEMDKNPGGRPITGNTMLQVLEEKPTLADMGMSKMESSRWQAIWFVPEQDRISCHIGRIFGDWVVFHARGFQRGSCCKSRYNALLCYI